MLFTRQQVAIWTRNAIRAGFQHTGAPPSETLVVDSSKFILDHSDLGQPHEPIIKAYFSARAFGLARQGLPPDQPPEPGRKPQ